MRTLSTVSGAYLAALDAPASTTRQRRWALEDLATFAAGHLELPDPPAARALAPDVLDAWLTGHKSIATARAKAAAVRALTRFALEHHLLTPEQDTTRTLRRPAPPPAAVDPARGRLLLAAAAGDPPWGVPTHVWIRFAAHVHLLAATGAPEAELAAATVEDLTARHDVVNLPRTGPCPLPDPARRALESWLSARTSVTTALQGSDPHALWIRLHPGKDRRTGHIAPAGLRISARGLRLSFATCRDALLGEDPRLAATSVKDVRALGRAD